MEGEGAAVATTLPPSQPHLPLHFGTTVCASALSHRTVPVVEKRERETHRFVQDGGDALLVGLVSSRNGVELALLANLRSIDN